MALRTIPRRAWRPAAALAISSLCVVALLAGAERSVREAPGSCGVCHSMHTPMRLWAEGEHHGISCQACHALDRFDGLRMLWGMVRGASPGDRHAQVDAERCAACHVGGGPLEPQIGRTPGHRVHALGQEIDCLACHGVSTHKVRPTFDSCAACHAGRKVPQPKNERVHCLSCHEFRARRESFRPAAGPCPQAQ